MGDHFVLLVDRLLTESTLEAVIQSKNRLPSESTIENKRASLSIHRMDMSVGSFTKKSEECRICHDEDDNSNMDTPCSCRGSLKYAHRTCVQRWCNEKGDTICEICHQQFRPDYTAPPPLFSYGGIPVNFRGNWEILRRDLHAPQFMSMASTDGSFLDPNFEEYPVPTSRSMLCCRIITVILLMLRTIGILVPIYVIVKALTAIQRRRRGQGLPIPAANSEEENELPRIQSESHLIHVP
ncbi:uncharacterized protein [Henckelia pumila]|uniref:uncharacterized protein isoform X2 n=1 Tax=Henckelia pumila TaxID=405737 RepID=UPI003C6E886B